MWLWRVITPLEDFIDVTLEDEKDEEDIFEEVFDDSEHIFDKDFMMMWTSLKTSFWW